MEEGENHIFRLASLRWPWMANLKEKHGAPGGVSRFLGESPICPCERPVHGLGGPGLATRPWMDAADSEPAG